MRTVFQDYYRCAKQFGEFAAPVDLSAPEGYFTFDGATCYGRCRGSASRDVAAALDDLSDDVTCSAGRVRLPFELSEVVENLRQERYNQTAHHYVEQITAGRLARSAYYFVRPILPVSVRKHLQRVRLSGWEAIPFPRWPVDTTIETLMRRAVALELKAKRLDRMPFIWFWPEGANGCAIMTHDVEAQPGRDFCEPLMDLDDAYGIKASFQLVPEKRYPISRAFFDGIRRRGFEANVHDLNHDGQLFNDRQLFLRRAARINEYGRQYESRGFRAAAMYRDARWLGDLDFSYDMSVPNVAHLEPQRGGCCTVMPYFIDNLVELPLTTIQDYSLFHIIGDYSIELWKTQIEQILSQHGLVTLLAHPDYLIDDQPRRVYADLLAHVRRLVDAGRVWMPLPGDVARWWRNRRDMVLVNEGGGWRIDGPDSDRARLAYATIQNDRVVYEVEHVMRGVL
jgi:hypothetical protein